MLSLNDMFRLFKSQSSAISLRTNEARCSPERVEDPTCSVLYLKEVEEVRTRFLRCAFFVHHGYSLQGGAVGGVAIDWGSII